MTCAKERHRGVAGGVGLDPGRAGLWGGGLDPGFGPEGLCVGGLVGTGQHWVHESCVAQWGRLCPFVYVCVRLCSFVAVCGEGVERAPVPFPNPGRAAGAPIFMHGRPAGGSGQGVPKAMVCRPVYETNALENGRPLGGRSCRNHRRRCRCCPRPGKRRGTTQNPRGRRPR